MTALPRPASPGPMVRGRGAMYRPAYAAMAAVVGTTLVAVVDPNQPGHYPTCPFLAMTGWYCPGCGSLRAMHDLAHGDLHGALARNPLTVLALPFLLVGYAVWVRRLWRGDPRRWAAPAWLIWAFFGLVVLYGVLRNLPGWTWLSPA